MNESVPIPEEEFTFTGWWEKKREIDHAPEPWETFRIILFGNEAGDMEDNPQRIRQIVADAGYELILRPLHTPAGESEEAKIPS